MNIAMFLPRDGEAASRLHKACFPDPWSEAGFSALAATGAFGFKAVKGARMAGLILGRCAGDECEILTFAVDPACRNQGVGTRLLLALLASLEPTHIKKVFLEVAVDNQPAIALYRNAGFADTGRRAGYYTAGGQITDAIIMCRTLTA